MHKNNYGETMKTILLYLLLSSNQTVIYNTPTNQYFIVDIKTNPIQILVIEENYETIPTCIQNKKYNLKDINFCINNIHFPHPFYYLPHPIISKSILSIFFISNNNDKLAFHTSFDDICPFAFVLINGTNVEYLLVSKSTFGYGVRYILSFYLPYFSLRYAIASVYPSKP